MASPDFKVGARILVVGYNGSGKSSLINKLAGNNNLTTVGDALLPTQHEAAAIGLDHNLKIPVDGEAINQLIMLFDTQGFGGTTSDDRRIAESIVGIVKKADVVLICHKLYQRVDGKVAEELKELVRILGSKLMKQAIFVFTCGDEYIIRCRPKPVANLPNNEIPRQMRVQAEGMKQNIVKILTSLGISQEIADNIPYCITSADQDDLPTGNWVDDLWQKCERKCTPEAAKFIGWFNRHKSDIKKKGLVVGGGVGGGVVSVVGGLAGGAAFGALIGTAIIPIPGVGTAAGAAVGGVGSLIGGAAVGTVTGAGIGGVGGAVGTAIKAKVTNT